MGKKAGGDVRRKKRQSKVARETSLYMLSIFTVASVQFLIPAGREKEQHGGKGKEEELEAPRQAHASQGT